MDEWYEELDFEENPFSTNPSDFVKNIVGRDEIIDDLVYRVKAGTLVYVEGPVGSGKSSLLRMLIRKFRGKGQVIYVNCEKFENDLNIEDLLVQRNGLIKGMLMKQKPKNMILLLDNVKELSFKNMERIKYFFDENFLRTVVFTGEGFDETGFSDSLVQRIEGRVVNLPDLETYQIVDLVRERVGDIKFLSDEMVELVAEASGNNPRQVLKNLEEISEYVVGIDEDIVTEKHVREVLGLKSESKVEEKVEEPSVESEDIPKVEIIEADEEPAEEPAEKSDEESDEKVEDSSSEDSDSEKKDETSVESEIKDEIISVEVEESVLEPEVKEEKKSSTKTKGKKEEAVIESEEEVVAESEEKEELDTDEVLSKPIVAEEESENDKKKASDEEDDDFFADDFFDDDVEGKEEKKKKEKEASEDDYDDYDDFFDDDFEK